MKRDEFISTLGISLAAVCAGCLASCGKGDDPAPASNGGGGGGGGTGGGGTPPPSQVTFTADLNSEVKNIGDTKSSGGVILARIAAGNVESSFTAVQQACTHEGTSINYNAAQGQFVCPNHGSVFAKSGSVITGPATVALQKYSVSIAGNTLTVS